MNGTLLIAPSGKWMCTSTLFIRLASLSILSCNDIHTSPWFRLNLICPMTQTRHYGGDFTHGFDTQNYPKLQGSLGTQPENTHEIQRQTQPNPYPWIFSGNTLGYPWVPTLNFCPWVPWVPALSF